MLNIKHTYLSLITTLVILLTNSLFGEEWIKDDLDRLDAIIKKGEPIKQGCIEGPRDCDDLRAWTYKHIEYVYKILTYNESTPSAILACIGTLSDFYPKYISKDSIGYSCFGYIYKQKIQKKINYLNGYKSRIIKRLYELSNSHMPIIKFAAYGSLESFNEKIPNLHDTLEYYANGISCDNWDLSATPFFNDYSPMYDNDIYDKETLNSDDKIYSAKMYIKFQALNYLFSKNTQQAITIFREKYKKSFSYKFKTKHLTDFDDNGNYHRDDFYPQIRFLKLVKDYECKYKVIILDEEEQNELLKDYERDKKRISNRFE